MRQEFVQRFSRAIAGPELELAMFYAQRGRPAAGVQRGDAVVYYKQHVSLNGKSVLTGRVAGSNYVGRAVLQAGNFAACVALDGGEVVPSRAFETYGPVLLIARKLN